MNDNLDYKKLYNQMFKAPKVKDKIQRPLKEKLENQIKNSERKLDELGDKGYKDTRNPLEKLLNLKENTPWYEDIFDLLGRPQQALFGAIDSMQNNEDVLKGFLDGGGGSKDTKFKKILTQTGLFDGEKENESLGKLGLSDVLGFIGDVALDPVDLALIPVTGGASASTKLKDGAKIADKTHDVLKATDKVHDVLNATDKVKDSLKALDTLDDVLDTGKKVTEWKSLSDLAFEGLGKGIKSGVKLGDDTIKKVLAKLDNTRGVRNTYGDVFRYTYDNSKAKIFEDLGKKILDKDNYKGKVFAPMGRLEKYQDVKESIYSLFNNINKNRDTLNKIGANNLDKFYDTIDDLTLKDDNVRKAIKETAQEISKQSGKNFDEVYQTLNQDIFNLKQYRGYKDKKLDMESFLNFANKGHINSLDEKAVGDLEDILKNIFPTHDPKEFYKTKNGMIKLKVKDDLAKDINFNKFNDLVFDKPINYTKEQLENLQKLDKLYSEDNLYKKLYDTIGNSFVDSSKIIDDNLGTKLSTIYSDNKDYVRNVYNTDLQNIIKRDDEVSRFLFDKKVLKGKTDVLKDRYYDMSALEANNIFKNKINFMINNPKSTLDEATKEALNKLPGLFHDTFTTSFEDYISKVPQLAKDSKNIDDILIKETFNPFLDFVQQKKDLEKIKDVTERKNKILELSEKANNLNIRNIKEFKGQKVPKDLMRINEETARGIASKLSTLEKELGIEGLDKTIKYLKKEGNNILINPEVVRLLDVNTKKSANILLRIYDKGLDTFKKFKTTSITNQLNNLSGNMINLRLGGVDFTKQAELYPKAVSILSSGKDLMEKSSKGIKLTIAEQKNLELYKELMSHNIVSRHLSIDLKDAPESIKTYFRTGKKPQGIKKITDGLPYLSAKMNEGLDNLSRTVMYLEAKRNPKVLKNLNVSTPIEAVKKVLFDPNDLTMFERDVMKRIIPFYTFTKKNLVYHIQNLGSANGSKYYRLMKEMKGLRNLATGGEDMESWVKDGLYIPIPSMSKTGSYRVLRAKLPIDNVFDTFRDPLRTFINSSAPMIKGPFEYTLNKQVFNNQDIEKFPGERSRNLPFLTKKQEYLLGSMTGLDVPIKSIYKPFKDDKNSNTLIDKILDTATIKRNNEDVKLSNLFERKDYLDKRLKQNKQNITQEMWEETLRKINQDKKNEKMKTSVRNIKRIKKNMSN